jgi:hypothetical protein
MMINNSLKDIQHSIGRKAFLLPLIEGVSDDR